MAHDYTHIEIRGKSIRIVAWEWHSGIRFHDGVAVGGMPSLKIEIAPCDIENAREALHELWSDANASA